MQRTFFAEDDQTFKPHIRDVGQQAKALGLTKATSLCQTALGVLKVRMTGKDNSQESVSLRCRGWRTMSTLDQEKRTYAHIDAIVSYAIAIQVDAHLRVDPPTAQFQDAQPETEVDVGDTTGAQPEKEVDIGDTTGTQPKKEVDFGDTTDAQPEKQVDVGDAQPFKCILPFDPDDQSKESLKIASRSREYGGMLDRQLPNDEQDPRDRNSRCTSIQAWGQALSTKENFDFVKRLLASGEKFLLTIATFSTRWSNMLSACISHPCEGPLGRVLAKRAMEAFMAVAVPVEWECPNCNNPQCLVVRKVSQFAYHYWCPSCTKTHLCQPSTNRDGKAKPQSRSKAKAQSQSKSKPQLPPAHVPPSTSQPSTSQPSTSESSTNPGGKEKTQSQSKAKKAQSQSKSKPPSNSHYTRSTNKPRGVRACKSVYRR